MTDWEAQAKYYQALWRSVLRDGAMASEQIKGDVVVSFEWSHGVKDDVGQRMHSDEAERLARDIGQSAVVNALASDNGESSVIITVRTSPSASGGKSTIK